jgi:CYTH domain-containing protein
VLTPDRRKYAVPEWVGPEVTLDERFTGGALAATDRPAMRATLTEVLGEERARRLIG